MKKNLITSSIIIFIVILVLTIILSTEVAAVPINHEDALELYNIELNNVEYVESNDIDYVNALINDCLYQMSNAHQAAEYFRKLHYSEDFIGIRIMQHDWWMYKDLYDRYQDKLHELKRSQIVSDKQIKEYPTASVVWEMLKKQGYNDYICAGILGNMMVECGGQTLNLNYQAYGSSGYYYGLCQWNSYSYGNVFGKDLEGQVYFLLDTIRYEFDTYGFNYSTYFDYNSFLNLNNEKDAAIAFAKCYERCGSDSYSMRQNCATVAYNYFSK